MKKAVLPAWLYPTARDGVEVQRLILGHFNIASRFIVQAFQKVVSEIGIRSEVE